MSMQQYRNEKKQIEEAAAKVREVVRTASKNDIILALHNFDFDVNKTIQAFCDGSSNHICFEIDFFLFLNNFSFFLLIKNWWVPYTFILDNFGLHLLSSLCCN